MLCCVSGLVFAEALFDTSAMPPTRRMQSGCAVVRLQAPKQIQGAGTDIDLAVGNRD
jgi:hypothetical protein